jgi:hemolysin III
MSTAEQQPSDIPLLRGVLHAVFCPVAMICGGVLAWLAPTPRAALALLIMSMGFAAIFGTSSIYHRVRWRTPRARRIARQADHSMIFLGMATTYTAVWLIALDGWISDIVLIYAWIAAAIGMLSKLWFLDAAPSRHWLSYMGMGLVAIVVIPSMWQTMGATGVGLMLLGSVIIALGGIAYVKGGPNPVPGWFGHHEVFHVGTIIGCFLFLGALANFALQG